MEREQVFKVVSDERAFQEKMKLDSNSHIVEDFPLSSGMEAIRYNLEKANQSWYGNKAPYTDSMDYIRKIAAICIQMGEKYGMPNR